MIKDSEVTHEEEYERFNIILFQNNICVNYCVNSIKQCVDCKQGCMSTNCLQLIGFICQLRTVTAISGSTIKMYTVQYQHCISKYQ